MLAASQYMMWHENAERSLASLYQDPAITRYLQTPRYWHIRTITASTERPYPLIASEIAEQQAYIESLREQLTHYQALLTPDPDEAMLLCDTNVFIHGKPFHQVRWNEQFTKKKARLLLPLVVLDELDYLKDQGNRAAGGALKDLDARLVSDSALRRVQLRENVSLQLVDEPSGHERLGRVDDEIVHQAVFYASVGNCNLTLFTLDRGMRVRAAAADLDARMLPSEYERKQEVGEVNDDR